MAGCSWPEKMPSRNAFRGLFVVLRESIWSHFGIDAVGVYPLQAGHEGQPSSNDGPAFYGMIHELGKNLSLSHFFWWWVLLGFYYPTMIVCFYIIAKNYTYICIYIYVDNRIYNWDVILGIIMPNNEEINNLWTPQQVIWISPWWKATAHIKARSPK
jgi:hypothetical protein